VELAQIERNLREGEAQLPIEEQLSLNLRRLMEANIPSWPAMLDLNHAAMPYLERVTPISAN
jgi:hypothetical protein